MLSSRATESNIKLISKCENSTSQFPALKQQVVFMESISLEGIEVNVAFMCVLLPFLEQEVEKCETRNPLSKGYDDTIFFGRYKSDNDKQIIEEKGTFKAVNIFLLFW